MEYYTRKTIQDIEVLTFSFKDITLEQHVELKKSLGELSKLESKQFVINLSQVAFLSSLVIADIVFFAKEIRAKNGEVVLCEMSKEIYHIFDVTRLHRIFKAFGSEQEAIDSFGK